MVLLLIRHNVGRPLSHVVQVGCATNLAHLFATGGLVVGRERNFGGGISETCFHAVCYIKHLLLNIWKVCVCIFTRRRCQLDYFQITCDTSRQTLFMLLAALLE